jgi:tape measure domain-containing protein
VAAYRADIEIGVKGIQQLQAITKQINTLSTGVDSVNKRLAGASQSLNAYNANLAKAAATLNKVNAGTVAEADAVRQYVQALGQANAARDRQNRLIQQQIALQRKAVPTANAGFGVQGPALPPATGAAARTSRGIGGRLGGAVSGAVIGGAFPLLFGQSGGAAAGGAIGGLVGGLAGPGGSFAGSLLGTLIGDIASRGQAVKQLGEDLGFSAEQTKQLAAAFKTANTDVEKFTAVIQNIRGLGLELEDQAKAIQLVTTLTDKYGGSFEKTGNAITSALESGKVTQATLNQLTSQGINIQGELANKYGVSRDAILKMAKDGDISVQTLIDTLVKMGNEGVTAANKPKTAMERLTASVNALGQSLAGLATNLVRAFGPAMQWLTDRVTDFVNAVSRAVSRLSDLMNGGRMAQAEIQAARAAETTTQRKFGVLGGIRAFNPAAQKFYESQKQAELRRLVPGAFAPTAPAAGPLTSFQVPSQAAPSGGAGAKGPKPPEDRTALLQEDLEAMKLMSVTQDGIRDALFEGNKELAIRLEYDQKVADINRDAAKALLNANYETEKAVIRAQEIVRLKDAELEMLDKQRELQRDIEEIYKETFRSLQEGVDWEKGFLRSDEIGQFIKDAVKELENLQLAAIGVSQGIGNAIGSALTNGIVDLVTGANTVKQVFADLLQTVGQILANEGAKMIATYIAIGIAKLFAGLGGGSIFGGKVGVDTTGALNLPDLAGAGGLSTSLPGFAVGGGLAAGGPVSAGTPYVVGERGPELFLPSTGGNVMSNNDLRSAMGSSSAGGGTPVLNMNFQTTNIGGVEYVSRDQLEQAMAATRRQAASDGAKRGMTMTLDKLQQSPGTRSRVGLR